MSEIKNLGIAQIVVNIDSIKIILSNNIEIKSTTITYRWEGKVALNVF